jgi:hypothetical protein
MKIRQQEWLVASAPTRHSSERDHDIAATLDAIRMLVESKVWISTQDLPAADRRPGGRDHEFPVSAPGTSGRTAATS